MKRIVQKIPTKTDQAARMVTAASDPVTIRKGDTVTVNVTVDKTVVVIRTRKMVPTTLVVEIIRMAAEIMITLVLDQKVSLSIKGDKTRKIKILFRDLSLQHPRQQRQA